MDRLIALLKTLLLIIWGVLLGWLVEFVRLAANWACKHIAYCRSRAKGPREPHVVCIPIPEDIYQRPDPYLYSQDYLRSLGIAITWDNPDIWLELGGVIVDSHDLLPNTNYIVVVQVWNGSFLAPAPGLPVQLTERTFGVGGGPTLIGSTAVDLPVRGAPGHPALARIPWRTPAAGHHCLEAALIWADDANSLNNVGQENTDIRRVQAGTTAKFAVPITNRAREAKEIRLGLTAYRLPPAPISRKGLPRAERKSTPRPASLAFSKPGKAVRESLDRVVQANRWDAFPPDAAWMPKLSADVVRLAPGQTQAVEVTLTPPSTAAPKDRRMVTLVAADERGAVVGGVTLIAEVANGG